VSRSAGSSTREAHPIGSRTEEELQAMAAAVVEQFLTIVTAPR